MRYTRYEYNKYGKVKFLCSIIIISGLSIGGGFTIGKILFKGNVPFGKNDSSEQNYAVTQLNVTALQCGCYLKKENAYKCAEEIKNVCSPFVVEENSKYRVIGGIYKEDNISNEIQHFLENNIETSKVKFVINNNDRETEKYMEILDGYISITDKLQEDQVKSIKSNDFKVWASNIAGKNEDISNKRLKEITKVINSMPEELNRDNIQNYTKQIYDIISEK